MDNLDNTTTTRSKQAREGSPDGQQTVRKFGTVLSTSYLARQGTNLTDWSRLGT